MPWDELRAAQQRCRRSQRALDRGNRIGNRYCTVCLNRLQWGERTTKRFCSDACRQKAHRLRHTGRWPRQLKLHALHRRCLDRLVLAGQFENLRGDFSQLCHLRKRYGIDVDPQPAMYLMHAAHREQKRAEATEQTMGWIYRRVRA
jgi:hypothetical protein